MFDRILNTLANSLDIIIASFHLMTTITIRAALEN